MEKTRYTTLSHRKKIYYIQRGGGVRDQKKSTVAQQQARRQREMRKWKQLTREHADRTKQHETMHEVVENYKFTRANK